MVAPNWASLHYTDIDYQNILYYSAPKKKESLSSLDEVDEDILSTFEKLGIPLTEQKKISKCSCGCYI
jgi:Fe-S cluster assembly protein SufB